MAGDASAYAALGLEPGADSSAVEQAYKRLIKEHHPDRAGGDARRAAELNRAYRELRAHRRLKDALELIEEDTSAPPRGRAWIGLALILAIAALDLIFSDGRLRRPLASVMPRVGATHVRESATSDAMDQPLHMAAIDREIESALQMARTRDEMALASASSDCHRQLRRQPSVLQLDRCAAFDDAVVQLQDRDPLRDQGPFSELAVTGRIWSGATALSDDSVAIDSRLNRIRLRAELALAPLVEPPKQPSPSAAN
jgi:DnaJ-domain-containing protein 1